MTNKQLKKADNNFLKYGKIYPNILDRIKGSFVKKSFIGMPSSGVRYGFSSVIPKANSSKFVSEGYDKSVNLYSVVNKLAKTCSYAPWGAYKVVDENKYKQYKSMSQMEQTQDSLFRLRMLKEESLEPVSDKLNDLFDRPNSQQSGQEYLEGVFTFKLLTGNAYEHALLLDFGRNSGKPQEMHLLPAQYIEIQADSGYPVEVEKYILNDGTQKTFEVEEVMHSKYFNPNYSFTGQHLYGFSPLQAGWLSIMQDNDSKKAAIELLQNRGPRGILFSEIMGDNPTIAKEQAGLLKERWRQTRMEEKGGIVPMPGKGKYEQIGLSIGDLKILEISDYTLDDICNLYGVWSGLFNSGNNQKYDNVKQFRKDFIMNCVLPELNARKSVLNHKLQTDWGYKGSGIVVDYDDTVYPELQEDFGKMVESMSKADWFTKNEKRIFQGWSAIEEENADKLVTNRNQMLLENLDKNINDGTGTASTV